MPLVYQQNINLNTRLGVWHIAEDEDFFLKKVCLQNDIRHPHKRLQHLAGRYLLQELYPDFPTALILIADTRKPFLDDEAYHFSISHCGDYAAAIVSNANRVGADIEVPQHKIAGIRNKFLTEQEQLLLPQLPLDEKSALTLCWSIKEAIFKWYGAGKVDFRGHIHIKEIVSAGGQFSAVCIFSKQGQMHIQVHGLFFNGNCVTWIVS